MPQFDQILATYASQIFWMLITFAILYFVIGKGMVSKIDANVDARERRIADDLVAAEQAKAEAEALGGAGEAGLAEARADVQAAAARARARAAKDSEARLAKADAEIGAIIAEAEADVDGSGALVPLQ